MHYVIIGASAAGLSAVETLRRLDPDSVITVISKEKDIAYSRCLTTYFLAGRITRNNLYLRTPDDMQSLNAQIILGAEAVDADAQAKTVTLSDGKMVSYDKLLAASGATPIIPDIPGIRGDGVYSLRTIVDADNIVSKLAGATSAVILGDGLVSITAALALHARGIKVSVVGIASHILATFLDYRAAEILQKKMNSLGIDLFLGRSFRELHRDRTGNFTGVTMTDGSYIDAGLAVIAAGVRPEYGYLQNLGISANPGILVNEFMESNIPDIYAAGDTAQAYDIVRGGPAWNPLWPNAVEQGLTAAYNMAGIPRAYDGCTNMNSLNIGGISAISMGITHGDSSDLETVVVTDRNSTYEKLVFSSNRLVGYILLGNTEKAGVLSSLVSKGEVSTTQKAKLLKGSFGYTSLAGLMA